MKNSETKTIYFRNKQFESEFQTSSLGCKNCFANDTRNGFNNSFKVDFCNFANSISGCSRPSSSMIWKYVEPEKHIKKYTVDEVIQATNLFHPISQIGDVVASVSKHLMNKNDPEYAKYLELKKRFENV